MKLTDPRKGNTGHKFKKNAGKTREPADLWKDNTRQDKTIPTRQKKQ